MDSFIIFSLKPAKRTTLFLMWFSKLWQGCYGINKRETFSGISRCKHVWDFKEIKETETGREISKANGSGKRKERSLQMSHVEGGLNR